MKKLQTSIGLILIAVLFLSFTNSIILEDKTRVIGTWDYSVPEAPSEYQKGELTIENIGNTLSGHINVNDGQTELEDLILEKNTLTFIAFIEDAEVSFKLDFDKKHFAGNVSYSEETLSITGIKQ